jgi:hypothetical protein
MIPVVMTQNEISHAGQIDAELASVVEDGLWPRAGVEQEAASVDLDESRETYAGPIIGLSSGSQQRATSPYLSAPSRSSNSPSRRNSSP